ncbi:dolichyl-diphosphooligosaccharide--protein glycotransferase [Candidatus Nitrosarchaeum limnium SFB1]|uniref:dolichyl-phosphooligosaccharide-protein glycotransferase n=1 Tax=Candidatus Nitrosarchaeum limnium SFB1 TaxID=886738 RepID=F3KN60_9ARCH|nr:dolichyl-diphosphooligosaccharide--protein glycotransferase [Candidatus Nitrosarchaeum limnium SFB1]
MISNATLVSVGKFDFKLHHLLIIGILSLSFSVSFLIRSQAADYGWELNEFDPFFNYRATQYIVDNGINAYYQWNDNLSWYPHGRDVSQTSQIVLHLTAALTYWVFGGGMQLYDFAILFPVVFGSLSGIVIFALVRVIGGTTAGLFSALLFSVSLPMILRGTIGWFKSEPLGLFFGLLALYFLLSGITSKNKKIAIVKLIAAGITVPLSISAWGGSQFFIIPIGIFFLTLPFLRTDHKFLLWSTPLFTATVFLISLNFERLASSFIFGLGGISLIIPTIFVISCIFIQSKSSENKKTRNGVLFLASILIIGTVLLIINASAEFLPLPSYRYLNAINPFLTTSVPLVDSVAEHASTTINQSFFFHSILMIFAGLGIWLIIKNNKTKESSFIKNDMLSFSLIIGLIGIYVSSAFVRLEVFASLSLIILSSIGLAILVKEILKNTEYKKFKNLIIKSSFLVGIIILLMIPLYFPSNGNWVSAAKAPPTILNGGSSYPVSTDDWLETMEWIKNNTPKDAVVASWWDYGYWISTLGERATIADNSTLITSIIQNLAMMFMSSPDKGWQMLNDMQTDYVVIFVTGQRLSVDNGDQPLYVLQGGGDESKKQWFIRIAEEPLEDYLYNDGISGTEYFWNDTLLGQMFPFTPLAYVNLQTQQQSATYQPGFTPIYVKDIKYPSDGNGPLQLVHASPSFNAVKGQPVIGVFVYKVNKDFVPTN